MITEEEHLSYIKNYETGYNLDGTLNGNGPGIPCHLCTKWINMEESYYYTCRRSTNKLKTSSYNIMLFYHIDCFKNAAGDRFVVEDYSPPGYK